MLVFLDANVLCSAAWSTPSRLELFWALAQAGHCTLCTSAFATDEARRNINAKRPESAQKLESLLSKMKQFPESPAAGIAWARERGLPEKDAPILAAAAQAGAQLVVTGDKEHFGHLYAQALGDLRVLPPAAALQWIVGAQTP